MDFQSAPGKVPAFLVCTINADNYDSEFNSIYIYARVETEGDIKDGVEDHTLIHGNHHAEFISIFIPCSSDEVEFINHEWWGGGDSGPLNYDDGMSLFDYEFVDGEGFQIAEADVPSELMDCYKRIANRAMKVQTTMA